MTSFKQGKVFSRSCEIPQEKVDQKYWWKEPQNKEIPYEVQEVQQHYQLFNSKRKGSVTDQTQKFLAEYNQDILRRVMDSKIRSFNVIQTTHNFNIQRKKRLKGSRLETKNLARPVHSAIVWYLRAVYEAKQLENQELQLVASFLKGGPSLKKFKRLFESSSLRQKCQKFLTSRHFIDRLLRGTTEIHAKMTALKYIQKMRRIGETIEHGWKDGQNKAKNLSINL